MEGVYKIGHTTRSIEDRLAELNASTSVIEPMRVLVSFQVFNSYEVEQEAHKLLAEYRVREDREYFKVDLMGIVGVIGTSLDSMNEPYKLFTYDGIDLDEEKLSELSGTIIEEFFDKENEELERQEAEETKTHNTEMELMDKADRCSKMILEMYNFVEHVSFREQDVLCPDFDKNMSRFNKKIDAIELEIKDAVDYDEAIPVRKLNKQLEPLHTEIKFEHNYLKNNYKKHLGFFRRIFG